MRSLPVRLASSLIGVPPQPTDRSVQGHHGRSSYRSGRPEQHPSIITVKLTSLPRDQGDLPRDERAGAALAAAGESNPGRTAAFMDRYAWYVHRVEIMTNETFEISVEMPGEIIGSNGESVVARTATWKFRAGDLGYGDVELMVSSFIATEPAR